MTLPGIFSSGAHAQLAITLPLTGKALRTPYLRGCWAPLPTLPPGTGPLGLQSLVLLCPSFLTMKLGLPHVWLPRSGYDSAHSRCLGSICVLVSLVTEVGQSHEPPTNPPQRGFPPPNQCFSHCHLSPLTSEPPGYAS